MRFEIRSITLFVLLALVSMFTGHVRADDTVDVAKAKAKALFSLKASPSVSAESQPTRDVNKAIAEAKATSKPLYLWVAKYRKEIAEKLPPGIHAVTSEYHGLTEPYLVIKISDGDYQLDQSRLDQPHLEMIRKIVVPMSLRSESKRLPIVDVSRESVEPPLLAPTVKQPLTVAKVCNCSPLCVCGCQDGRACQCKTNYSEISNSSPTSQAGSVAQYRGVTAAVWPAPAQAFNGPAQSFFH